MNRAFHYRKAAFSLIELLVGCALIALIAGLGIPAFNSIGQSRGATAAAYQISGAVELARQEAISRRTFVWVGFQPVSIAVLCRA